MAEDGRNDGLLIELIGAAVLSGAYSGLVRQHPDALGLEKLRARWSARAKALADEVARTANRVTR